MQKVLETINTWEVIREQCGWEEVLIKWWFPFPNRQTFATPDAYFIQMMAEVNEIREACSQLFPKETDLIKALITNDKYRTNLNKMYLETKQRVLQRSAE